MAAVLPYMQDEMNLHNLRLGGVNINKAVFGRVLTVSLAAYLFLLPRFARRSPRVAAISEHFGLPLPTFPQAIAFLPAIILPDLLVPSAESDELRETCGSLMLVIMFCFPLNAYIFSSDWTMKRKAVKEPELSPGAE